MQYTNSDLELLRDSILLIVKEVKRICDYEEISYFLIGGTALGAVRHGGFIPWDDDFDIGMTRENYEKFLKIAPQMLSSSFFLQSYETEPNTPFYFAKVRMKGTLFVENYCQNIDMDHGIYIDIFPYDNVPMNIYKRKVQLTKTIILSELYIAKSTIGIFYTVNRDWRFLLKKILRKTLYCLLYPVSKRRIFNLLDNENKRYNDSNTELISYIKYPFLCVKRKNIEPYNSIIFENIRVSCCQNIEEYLCSHFGKDYMELPPLCKRVNHRPVKLMFKQNK